ncbi:hypothetical protein [Malonomonas rubra]|uniref:hypothetical protein n=1 Tax=Malonomonas rubra TaxID=57040 RepID=UPI0026EF552E|nr:hypothetical protein [Malonomonas rubra]
MKRKKLLLIILLVVLLLALFYAYFASPGSQRLDTGRRERETRTGALNQDARDKMVKLELLDREPEPYEGVQRDLFGDLFPRPKVVPPPPPKPVVKRPVPVPVPIIKPSPVEIVRRDLARFTFMGYLRKQDSWTIFLSSNGEIFLVQEGSRFGRNDQFHAVQITPEQLVIEQSTQGRIVIPLVEKQPLVPSSLPSAPSGATGRSAPESPEFEPAEQPNVPVQPRSPGQPNFPGASARPFRSNQFGGVLNPPAGEAIPETPTTQLPSSSNEVSNE